MAILAIKTNPIFSSIVRVLDVTQRVYMRLVSYVSPVSNARTLFGTVMRCYSRDFVQRRVRFFGVFEHNLTYFTLDTLKPGDCYLDIGANVGYFTLLAAKAVGANGKVISVEADPGTFRLLQENIALNPFHNIAARNIAATAAPCKVRIHDGDKHNLGTNSVVVDDEAGAVDGLPIRQILGQDLGRVRFIKIDVEGAERPLLEAILADLDSLPKDLVVAAEVSSASADLVRRFAEAGFDVKAMQNIYTMDYYLIRSYLARYGEDRNVHMVPVTSYDATYTDYVFQRRA